MLSRYVSHARCNIVHTRTLIPLFDLADWGIKQLVQTDLRFAECPEVLARTVPKKSICCFAFTMPAKLSINDVDVSGKRVFMRVDFNVPQDKADPTKSLGFKDFASGFMWFLVSEVYVFVFMFFTCLPINIATSTMNLVTLSLSTTSLCVLVMVGEWI